MAAHLKKRVYEEFTKVVQIPHEDTPAKRLRLSKPSKSAALHIDLCKATSSTDALQYLLHFARRAVEAESVEGVIRILLEHYYKEADSSVRLKIASLIGHLSKTPGFRPDCIVEDTINTLKNEKSHQVLAQLLHSLLLIGSQLTDTPSVRQWLVQVSCQHLSDTYFGVRNNCLQLLGCVGLTSGATALDKDAPAIGETGDATLKKDVQSIISDYFGDQDPRVRTAALKAMLQLHSRGMTIQQDIYDQACRLLSDDYEQVRSASVQLVWVLSQLYPESIVPIPSSNEEIRLVDDAFGKISHMVSDGSWMVRVQAAKTLGDMLQVSPHFLEQTLDKKLMSDLRRKRTAHERAKELFASGEFSSGRKWADDAPKEKLDTNTVNLMASGACGAFVHGLEDEMFEVRIAAVEALCQLARSSASFAEKCLDFLVDMFNDEIEEVRLQSIHVLREISTHITLREDQLDTVLAVLEDSSRDIREALHELLCYTNVSTKECIQLALLELLKNLNKYPTDRNSVWKCLKFLGQRHPTLVLPLVPELLSTHPYFDTPEPDMDDPAYIAVLVLVFNAAQTCPTMPALFSDHTFRHYAYLRDSLSHLVPLLTLPGRKQPYSLETAGSVSASASVEAAHMFLQQSLLRVENIQNLEAAGAQDLLKLTIRDLQRVGELQTELAGAADFCATYLHCQLLLSQALQEKLWRTAVPLCLKQNNSATQAAQQMVAETFRLEFLYSRLESRQMAALHHVRLQARALQLLLSARTRNSLDSLSSSCDRFLMDIEHFQRMFVTELPHLKDTFVDKVLELRPRLSSCAPVEMVKLLQNTLRQSGLLLPTLPPQIQKATATIIEPTGESDNPLRFTSGLVVALDIDATLEHVQDPQNTVKVQVQYPDGQSHLIHPKPADFRRPGPTRHRLITQVYLSHSAWTEPCQISVRLLLAYSSTAPGGAESEGPQTDIEGTIPFSKPVKVFIMPKPTRR
uniref:Integrator complex subunit 4 n=1 Tax=Periophthalmus magnuspinnatus TaxID=409849 RepID=A0A3B4AGE7_9GOBI